MLYALRTTGDKRTLGDMSLLEDSAITPARITPTKFSTSHAYGMSYQNYQREKP